MEREYKKFARGKLGRAERWIDTLAKFHQTTPRDKKSRTTGRETMRSADRSCTVSKEIIVIAEFENWAKLGFLSISKGFFQILFDYHFESLIWTCYKLIYTLLIQSLGRELEDGN